MNKYCLFACSDEIDMNNSFIDFIQAVQGICKVIDTKITHIDYSFAEDEQINNVSINESFFNSEAIEILQTKLQKKNVTELFLWSIHDNLEKSPYESLYCELRDTRLTNGYKYIIISFPMKLIEDMSINRIFSVTNQLLKSLNHLGKIDYALLTTIDSSLISTYFRGIFTSNLSEEEALDLAMWENKYVERKILLRNLFWGNLLSASHLKRIPDRKTFLNRLEDSIDGLHTTINGDDMFFMLPTSTIKSNPVTKTVETLLREYDLIMQPDDKDKGVVRRLVSR